MKTRFPLNCRSVGLLLLSTAALIGCGHKDTIVGKWQGVLPQLTGNVNGTYEFTPDGKETINIQTPRNTIVSGFYTVSGNNLTETMTSMTIGNTPFPLTPKEAQPRTNQFAIDGEYLDMINPNTGKSGTLTRVK